MFTGIVTDIGTIERLEDRGDLRARIRCAYAPGGIAIGASISCDGVCLTVVDRGPAEGGGAWFDVDISAETVARSNIRGGRTAWAPGGRVNLERALRLGDELGGHIVSGHVDGLAEVVSVQDEGDSTRIGLRAPEALARFIAPKGSVALNGTSLTVNEVAGRAFRRQHHPAHPQPHHLGRGRGRRPGEPRDRHAGALRRAAGRVPRGMSGRRTGPGGSAELSAAQATQETPMDRPTHSAFSDAISSIEEIIDDARNGRMFVLIDHEDRENEGDLVIPAQMCTPDAVNFMATHGRGLICLTLQGERLDALGLPLMAASNSSRHETAFTVSIEAREGVTTGISAHDRARTVAVAIDPRSGPQDIATPGHVFPLRAREGGVLVRAGHTEAAVDIPRLAGLNPSGVICEIMNEDGSMARLPDLVAIAQRHGLKIGTISDLIAYRRRHDNLVRETAVDTVMSEYGGAWQMRIFTDTAGGGEHIVLSKGDLDLAGAGAGADARDEPDRGPARHSPGRSHQLRDAMGAIAAEGRGVVVLLRDMGAKLEIGDHVSPNRLRQYGIGAQILNALGLSRLVLLTNSPSPRPVGLEGYGLSIAGTRPIPSPEA